MFKLFKKLLGISPVSQETVEEILTPQAPIVSAAPTESKPERAKDVKGKFVADNPNTPDVNEAWKGGKAPVKKVKAISSPAKPAVKEGITKGGNGAVKQQPKQSNKPKAPGKPKAKRK